MASNAPRKEGEHAGEVKERKGIKKGLYLLPSAFTAANIDRKSTRLNSSH